MHICVHAYIFIYMNKPTREKKGWLALQPLWGSLWRFLRCCRAMALKHSSIPPTYSAPPKPGNKVVKPFFRHPPAWDTCAWHAWVWWQRTFGAALLPHLWVDRACLRAGLLRLLLEALDELWGSLSCVVLRTIQWPNTGPAILNLLTGIWC